MRCSRFNIITSETPDLFMSPITYEGFAHDVYMGDESMANLPISRNLLKSASSFSVQINMSATKRVLLGTAGDGKGN